MKGPLIAYVHYVIHNTVTTAPNWRLMSFKLSHKLFLQKSKVTLVGQPSFYLDKLPFLQDIITPWLQAFSCKPFLWSCRHTVHENTCEIPNSTDIV